MSNNNNEQVTDLQTFHFGGQEGEPFRARMVGNEPCFVAKDLCRILGISKYRDVLRHLDDDELVSMFVDTKAGKRLARAVNESGFYHLIFLSRHPKARDFRRMVTMEILPTLRKTGRYETMRSRMSDGFLDLRDVPYESFRFMGGEVRMVESEGVKWYSINDVFRCIGSRTESTQSVRRLNAKRELARKIQLFGMTHPGWFTTLLGVRLLLSASKKVESGKELMLEFTEE